MRGVQDQQRDDTGPGLSPDLHDAAVSLGVGSVGAAKLAALAEACQTTRSVQAYVDLAEGLVEFGALTAAAQQYHELERWADANGRPALFRSNLAWIYQQLGWWACSSFELRAAMEAVDSNADQESIDALLAQLTEAVEAVDAETQFQRLQLAAAVEAARADNAGDVGIDRLARCVRRSYDPDEAALPEALDLLRTAQQSRPESRLIHHAALHCAMVVNDQQLRDATLRELEDLEIDSAEVAAIAKRVAAGDCGVATPESVRNWHQLSDLIATEGLDREFRFAAIDDLGRMAGRFGCGGELWLSYGVALMSTDQTERLREVVDRLVDRCPMRHAAQYNLTLLCATLDDTDSALRHARLSYKLAVTDGDRSDAQSLIDALSSRSS